MAGSPQKLMLEPRPWTPPLLPALTELLLGGRFQSRARPHCGLV